MKVLIIEDENLAQEELVRMLRKYFPDIDIVDIKYSTCSCSDTRGGGIWTPSAMLIYKTKE